MTHLYAGSQRIGGDVGTVAETACGLRKAYIFDRIPADVCEHVGRVTCPACLAAAAAKLHNSLPNTDFSAQQGKKAQ